MYVYDNPWIMYEDYRAWLQEDRASRTIREQISRATHIPHLFTHEERLILMDFERRYGRVKIGISGSKIYNDREAWKQLEYGVILKEESYSIEVRRNKRLYRYTITRYADGRCIWICRRASNVRLWAASRGPRTRGTTLEGMLIHIEGGR